jgi:hypothetical protein
MGSRNLPTDKGQPARKANLTAIYEPIVYKLQEFHRPVQERLRLLTFSISYTMGTGGLLPRGIKRQGREADHIPSSISEVKKKQVYTSTPPIRLNGVPNS